MILKVIYSDSTLKTEKRDAYDSLVFQLSSKNILQLGVFHMNAKKLLVKEDRISTKPVLKK